MNRFLIFIICFIFIPFNSCRKEDTPYNPCLKHFEIETLKPSTLSLDWIPYADNQELRYSNSKGEKIKLIRISNNDIVESLQSKFQIICPNDPLQITYIDYKTTESQNKFIVSDGQTALRSINLNIDVILDEKNSNLDDVKLADILKIDFNIKNNTQAETSIPVLQFPVLNRGFKDALTAGYLFYPTILLNNKLYSDVFSNYENEAQLKVYYSELGLVAFEIRGDLFTKIQ